MTTSHPEYRVAFHLIQILYFDADACLPPGRDYRRLWLGLSRFGSQKMTGAFWTPDNVPKKSRRFKIGDPNAFEAFDNRLDAPVHGGGLCQKYGVARPNQDCDLYITIGEESRCSFGATPPFFQFAVSNELIDSVGMKDMLAMLCMNLEILDASRPNYGFIDIARPEETFAGCAYTSPWYRRLPLHRYMEHARWIASAAEKRDEARSVFWGNYFGPRLLEKLGGREQFLEEWREATRLVDGSATALIWEFEHGVFIGLSKNPMGCAPGEILDAFDMANSEWLFKKLSRHNALLGGRA